VSSTASRAAQQGTDAARAASRRVIDSHTTNVTGFRPAEVWRRAAARILDLAIAWLIALWIISKVNVTPLDAFRRLRDDPTLSTTFDLGIDLAIDAAITAVAGALVELVLEVVPTAFTGATIGKAVFRIRAVRLPLGRRPGVLRSFVRHLFPTLAGLIPGIGLFLRVGIYLAALLRADRRGWHDLLAGTMVVPSARAQRALPRGPEQLARDPAGDLVATPGGPPAWPMPVPAPGLPGPTAPSPWPAGGPPAPGWTPTPPPASPTGWPAPPPPAPGGWPTPPPASPGGWPAPPPTPSPPR
jgi:uncharacterized RDD family membrane protein YckC